MPPADFTDEQALQLAEHYLGKSWTAYTIGSGQKSIRDSRRALTTVCYGKTWREAFRAAGVQLPLRPQYTAQGLRVMMADKAVCTATTNTMAKRIAAALNEHIPDRRGI